MLMGEKDIYDVSANELAFIIENNSIEGISRMPMQREVDAFKRFCELEYIGIEHVCQYVASVQPGARLRVLSGMDVRVGNHRPPSGGESIRYKLHELLERIGRGEVGIWEAHMEYETLHPFTDGNGRSGRMIWYWMMIKSGQKVDEIGFLHRFYYQTLDKYDKRR